MALVACTITVIRPSDMLGEPSQQLCRSETFVMSAITFTGILSQGLRIAPP